MKRMKKEKPKFNKGLTLERFVAEREEILHWESIEIAWRMLGMMNHTDIFNAYTFAKGAIKKGANASVLGKHFRYVLSANRREHRKLKQFIDSKNKWWS